MRMAVLCFEPVTSIEHCEGVRVRIQMSRTDRFVDIDCAAEDAGLDVRDGSVPPESAEELLAILAFTFDCAFVELTINETGRREFSRNRRQISR
jgi:hypothetical protein